MPTETDKKQQVQIWTFLETRCVELKFEGHSYSEIIKILEREFADTPDIVPNPSVLREWFGTKGKLRSYYETFAREEGANREIFARNIFKAHTESAIKTLVTLLVSPSHMVRLLSAKEILNRQLGEPVKPILSLSQERVNEFLEAANRINNENIQTDVSRGESVSVPQSV